MANRGIAQRTLGDVSYSGSGGVGDCPRLISTLGDPRETSGPRIDRIPSTRPPWRRRQFRELKKIFFLAPSKCRIDLFEPVANRAVLERQRLKKKLVPLAKSLGMSLYCFRTLERLHILCPRWTFGFGAALIEGLPKRNWRNALPQLDTITLVGYRLQ